MSEKQEFKCSMIQVMLRLKIFEMILSSSKMCPKIRTNLDLFLMDHGQKIIDNFNYLCCIIMTRYNFFVHVSYFSVPSHPRLRIALKYALGS